LMMKSGQRGGFDADFGMARGVVSIGVQMINIKVAK